MIEEIWKDVPFYEGIYCVSNLGNVKSLARLKSNQYNSFEKPESILKFRRTKKGYYNVMLYKNGNSKSFPVHRLVLMAFDRLPKEKEQGNHINGIKNDNRLENLEWTNNSGNQLHAFAMGLNKPRYGEDNNKTKLTKEQVLMIREEYQFGVRGFGAYSMGKRYGVGKAAILSIIKRKSWAHI